MGALGITLALGYRPAKAWVALAAAVSSRLLALAFLLAPVQCTRTKGVDMASMRIWRSPAAVSVLAALAFATALSALGYTLSSGSTPSRATGTISVSADARLNGAPDTLTALFAVTTTASSAASALDQNDSLMQRLQNVFTTSGVPASGLQTSDLSVSPTYNNKGGLTGYRTEDDLSVTMHNFTKASRAIGVAENLVGDAVQINGITFSLSNNSELLRHARALAMQQALAEAAGFTSGAGETVGAAIQISNQQQVTTPLPFASGRLYKSAFAAGLAVPIQAGTLQVDVHVNVTYRLLS